RGNELDLDPVGRVDLDNCPKIPGLEAMLGKITDENHGVERLVGHHFLGKSVTSLGGWPCADTIQTVSTFSRGQPVRPRVPDTRYFWPYAVASPYAALR